MKIVDSHCHAGMSWFEPIEMIVYQMDQNKVDHAVLIQHRGMYDSTYLLDCMSRYPGRFRVIAIVDSSRDDALQNLQLSASLGVAGIRLNPIEKSTDHDQLYFWKQIESLGLVVSSIGGVEEFASKEFFRLVSLVPDLTIVVEHLAGVNAHDKDSLEVYRKALELAQFPNVRIKVGGLGEICERPSRLMNQFSMVDNSGVIEMALDAFGIERMMWGSDYPPVSNREGYRNALDGIKRHPAFKTDEEREWIMGKTAIQTFNF